MQLVEVKLYGHLKKFQPTVKFAVKSLRELIRALETQVADFKRYFIDKCSHGQQYRVIVSGREFDSKQVDHPIGGTTVTIIPVLSGSGNFGKIILGVALIAGGIASGGIGFVGGSLAFGAAAGAAGISASSLILIGATLALSGIVGLFAHPKNDSEEENKASFIMNGGVNVSTANSRVPVIFGCGYKNMGLVVGSVTVSFAVRSYETDNSDD